MGQRTRGPGGAGLLVQARRVLLGLLTAEVAVLALTGVALYFVYRPSDAALWTEVRVAHGPKLVSVLTRSTHLYTAHLALLTALAAGVATVVSSGVPRWTGRLFGILLVPTACAAWYTGFLLPWDQLALWAVTVGTNISGYGAILRDQTRFVLTGGSEVLPSTVIRWLAVHAAIGGPVMGLLITLAWRRRANYPTA